MEDLESRWNFPSPDLLNLLLQIKTTEKNLNVFFSTKLSFGYRPYTTTVTDLDTMGWIVD